MLKVGLTGGIGSGKSEVSARLGALGALVIDADKIAREVVEPGTPGLAAVVAEFGDGVLLPGGGLDREKVGGIVFADPDRLKALNAIVHPLVGERMQRLMDAAPADAIVVDDVPLLVENRLAGFYDVVVVVDAPVEAQLDRLTAKRGMTADAAQARIDAQATREERRAVADHLLDNSGTLDELRAAVDAVWADLTARAAEAG
ncbi:dephospho-CoA kinase [Actinomadura parmotrematis]|uniref:Dephospho-CoA kinase n=1 Tax=Actinomadura parmotrematis TaxID=2864039 RepID=A0ABS7FL73_9ACTN|nr:dephospho-CoA kinase [Actinomadura parmotrematis]MBW8481108.1 dephospho-CoA kinase, long form [Actinomadura parmotrematis]